MSMRIGHVNKLHSLQPRILPGGSSPSTRSDQAARIEATSSNSDIRQASWQEKHCTLHQVN